MTLDELRAQPRPVPVRWFGPGGWHWGHVVEIDVAPNNVHIAIVSEGDRIIRKSPKVLHLSEPGVHP